MRNLRLIVLILLVLMIDFSNQSAQTNAKIIRLKYADSLVGSNTPGISFRDFYGNVQLEHGDVDVRSDFAKQYLELNKADLIGNVVITQRTLILKSPKIFYDGNTSISNAAGGVTITDKETYLKADGGTYNTKTYIANFDGNVYIEDDSARIFSNYIIHNRTNRKSFAYGDVWILGKYSNSILKSDTLINIPSDNYSLAYGNPILLQVDSTYIPPDTTLISSDSLNISEGYLKYDTLTITSDTMQAYRELFNEKYVFTGNVKIVRGGVIATSQESVFMKDEDYILLKGSPVVWYDSTQLFADSIIIRLPNNQLKTIEAYTNSIAVSRNDTLSHKRLDQIMGDRIYINIDSGKVKGITSIGEAKSLYFFRDEEGESGADRRTTDTINVEFIEGAVENIIWLGMTYAEFFPETFVYGKEESYYLPLFQWKEEKPKRQEINIPLKVLLTRKP